MSEVMLQQTQTERVKEKYRLFLREFPNFRALARANLSAVLRVWQGLGYNRRALLLQRLAVTVVRSHAGRLPRSIAALQELPGIGPYSAAAVYCFALNKPSVFIETNIRSVFLEEFFPRRRRVADAEIFPLVEASIDRKRPREWYYALMDYGVFLKSQKRGINRRSAQYARQSPFRGSNREMRGMLLRLIAANAGISEARLVQSVKRESEIVRKNLAQLQREGFIVKRKRAFFLKDGDL